MKSALLLSALLPALCVSADPPAPPAPAAKEKAAAASFTLQVLADNEKPASPEETNAADTDITTRLNKRLKVKFKTTVQEHGRILVELPALTPEQTVLARRLMEKPGHLDVRPLGPEGLVPVGKDDAAIKPGFVKLPYLNDLGGEEQKLPAGEKYLWVAHQRNLPRGSVKAALAHLDPGSTHHSVFLTLRADSGELMRKLSAALVGKPLALIIDGEVVSAPTIQEEFGQYFMISGRFDAEEAQNLAVMLDHPFTSAVRIVEPSTPDQPKKEGAR